MPYGKQSHPFRPGAEFYRLKVRSSRATWLTTPCGRGLRRQVRERQTVAEYHRIGRRSSHVRVPNL